MQKDNTFGVVTHIDRLKIIKKLVDNKTCTMSTSQKPELYPKIYETVIYWEGRMR